ncbi:MAG: hypothetical protein AB9M53_01000 [Leptothrix sp. (in: b-proteobacteria)]
MSQFRISVDLTDAAAQAGAIINAQVLPLLNQAVRAVVQQTRIDWMESVSRAKLWQGEKDAYVTTITAKMTGDFSGEVSSDYKYADEIDNGRPARDLKKMLDTSQKVRRTKDGRRFLIIPFTHQTPGNDATGPAMPQAIYDAAKTLKATKIVGVSERAAGEVTSLHPVWGTQPLGKKKQTPYLSNPRTRQAVMVPKLHYQWGERLQGQDIPKQYQGMVKMKADAGGPKHSKYLTFRIMMEGSKGWIVPPKPGQNIVRGVVERMQPLAEKVFAEAMKRGG